MTASPYPPLALAVLAISTGSILIRFAAAPALTVAFNRIALASVILAPFAARSLGAAWRDLAGRQRALLVLSGLALALHFATWIASLSYTSVAASVLLVNMAPVFTLVFSRVFLAEAVSPLIVLAIVLAMGGAALIAAGDGSIGPAPLVGDALALAGAATLSAYHVIGRGLRGALPLDAYVLGVWSTAAAALLAVALGAGSPALPADARTFLLFLALAVVPTLLGHGLVNRSLRVLPAPTVGLFLLGEPVAATLLAFLVLGEEPGAPTLAGGALVLAALSIVVRQRVEGGPRSPLPLVRDAPPPKRAEKQAERGLGRNA